MTARFQTCLAVVLKNEGGYVNHKADRGGPTNFGVTTAVYDRFRAKRGLQVRSVKEINSAEVEDIYRAYWQDGHCAYMPEPLDCLIFDAAVNHGATRAIKLLQAVLGVAPDGICGQDTMAALHEEVRCTSIDLICRLYLDERGGFFDAIIQRDPSQAVFAKGWLNRVDHLRTLIA